MSSTLILDSSTERGVVAIAKGEEVCFSRELPFGFQSSSFLMESIIEGFKFLNITPLMLKSVAVCLGPGAFTGIRVGASLAMGISFARNIPIIALNSLDGFITQNEGIFGSLIDVKMGRGAISIREKKQGTITFLAQTQLMSIPSIKSFLADCPEIISPNFGIIRKELSNILVETSPDVHYLACLAEKSFVEKKFFATEECAIKYFG